MLSLDYTTIDVFSETRFKGNPLAIVELPSPDALTHEQKQMVAKEFNLSETVFIHPSTPSGSIPINIFTPFEELPFAGHPTVGSGIFLLSKLNQTQVVLETKAGQIPVSLGATPRSARLNVPIDFKIHDPFALPTVKQAQKGLSSTDFVNGIDTPDPIVSLVKGMNFLLLEVSSEDALSRLRTLPQEELILPQGHVGEWKGFLGLYAFYEREDGVVRTRMFCEGIEDPATGSAGSALAGYLCSTRKGEGSWTIDIVQGVEMGRRSELKVKVQVISGQIVSKIELEGNAVEVMTGRIVV